MGASHCAACTPCYPTVLVRDVYGGAGGSVIPHGSYLLSVKECCLLEAKICRKISASEWVQEGQAPGAEAMHLGGVGPRSHGAAARGKLWAALL